MTSLGLLLWANCKGYLCCNTVLLLEMCMAKGQYFKAERQNAEEEIK